MFIVWGTTHAGKVDETPGGVFHVVTRFGHLYYVPLIPTGSFVVLEKSADGGFRGVQIPLSGKSLVAGWLRGFGIVGLIGAAIGTLMILLDDAAPAGAWVYALVAGFIPVSMLLATYKLDYFRRATYERAMELARYAGFNDVGTLMLEVAYGRLTAAQAEAELQRRQNGEPIPAQALSIPLVTQLADG